MEHGSQTGWSGYHTAHGACSSQTAQHMVPALRNMQHRAPAPAHLGPMLQVVPASSMCMVSPKLAEAGIMYGTMCGVVQPELAVV